MGFPITFTDIYSITANAMSSTMVISTSNSLKADTITARAACLSSYTTSSVTLRRADLYTFLFHITGKKV